MKQLEVDKPRGGNIPDAKAARDASESKRANFVIVAEVNLDAARDAEASFYVGLGPPSSDTLMG